MRKTFKKLLSILFIICIFALSSCSGTTRHSHNTKTKDPKDVQDVVVNFNNDLSLYYNKTFTTINDIHISLDSHMFIHYDDYKLELDVTIGFLNGLLDNSIINISDVKAYGNDQELVEQVLSNYDYENKDNTKLYGSETLKLKYEEKKETTFVLVIPDGNSDAKYRIDFKMNNVNASIHFYRSDYVQTSFIYVHNPALNPKVLEDAEVNQNSYFGFTPNSTGSISSYASYDWVSEESALQAKQNRINYIEENDAKLKALENELRVQGKSIEEIARACSLLRNQIRLDQYKDDPEGLEKLKERNMTKYGHEDGPTPDESYTKYGSWEMVLEKAYTTNRGMDACCGVYDLYFYLYNELPY